LRIDRTRKNWHFLRSLEILMSPSSNFLLRKVSGVLLSSVLFLVATGNVRAAEVFSPVFGFMKFDCPANSDTVVSAPFHPAPRWAGRAAGSPADQGGGRVRLSLKDSPAFAVNELASSPHFLYCRDTSGVHRGRHFRIVANGASTIDVTASLADLGTLTTDGLVSVIPAWTLETLFPPGSQTTLHASTGPLATDRVSELLFFDGTTLGTSLAPSRRFYVTATDWFEVGTFADAGNTVIEPGQAFLIRHPAGVAMTTFVPNQQVYGGLVTVAIGGAAAQTGRDTMIGLPRPVSITLDQLDFAPGQFVESATTAPGDRKDQLLVFDNTEALRNKQPDAVYFRSGGQWLSAAPGFPVSGSQPIEPSAGLLVRRAAGTGTTPILWVNSPTYDVTAP
jgi:uncharacterized protein (TIGR02597 family)